MASNTLQPRGRRFFSLLFAEEGARRCGGPLLWKRGPGGFRTSLNGANEVIAARVVSVGLVNKTQVHPREVFADPLTDRASAVVVAHNHPSGSIEPSKEDMDITGQLKSAGEILGIRLLDHIVFNQKGYYSFLESGLL